MYMLVCENYSLYLGNVKLGTLKPLKCFHFDENNFKVIHIVRQILLQAKPTLKMSCFKNFPEVRVGKTPWRLAKNIGTKLELFQF